MQNHGFSAAVLQTSPGNHNSSNQPSPCTQPHSSSYPPQPAHSMSHSNGNSAMGPPQVMPHPGPSLEGMQRPTEAWQQLLQTLRSPPSAQQRQHVIAILKSNPQLMAALIKKRKAEQQQQEPSIGPPVCALQAVQQVQATAARQTAPHMVAASLNYRKANEILRQNYKDLLLNDENHDIILKVKDKEFKAHQIILQFRCPVFKAMLSHDMLEKNKGIVEIPDCDPSAFEQFLLYIYTGNLEMLDESVMLGLYYIAHKYGMPNLKEICCESIMKSVSTTNVCDVISLALNHRDSLLLECGEKYFVDNASEVLVTTEWKSFIIENPIHANELFLKVHNNCLKKDRSVPSGGSGQYVVDMPANRENNVGYMLASSENDIAYGSAYRENYIPYGLANR